MVSQGLADRLRALKDEDGGHIVQYGRGPVSHLLLQEGLLDELHVWLYPQIVDATASDLLFHPGLACSFTLAGSQTLENDVVVHRYTVAREPSAATPGATSRA